MDMVLVGQKLYKVDMGPGGIEEHNDEGKYHLYLHREFLSQVVFHKVHRKNEGLGMDRKVVPVFFHKNKHTGCLLRM